MDTVLKRIKNYLDCTMETIGKILRAIIALGIVILLLLIFVLGYVIAIVSILEVVLP